MTDKQEISNVFAHHDARIGLASDVCTVFRTCMLKVAEVIPAGEARTTALHQLKATRDAVINSILRDMP